MNNRYIFRGKREDNGEWAEGDLMQWSDGTIRICVENGNDEKTATTVIPETVGQCTGLTDKNGKLIFGRDILRFVNDDGEPSVYEVFYDEVCAGWKIQEVECGALDDMTNWENNRKYFEVIGNSYDDPELLLEVEEMSEYENVKLPEIGEKKYIDVNPIIRYLLDDTMKSLFEAAEDQSIGKMLLHKPAADVAEVVRCKDCRHFKKDNGGNCSLGSVLAVTNESGYCSYGERTMPK